MPDNVDFIQEQQAELLERQINAARVKHCGASSVTRQYLLPVVRLIRQPRVVFPVRQSLKQKTNITGERHEYSY